MCSFEENSWLFNEKERAKGPKSAFPQQGSPKSDRLLGCSMAFDAIRWVYWPRVSGDSTPNLADWGEFKAASPALKAAGQLGSSLLE